MRPVPYQLGCSVLTERRFRGRGEFRVRVGERVEPATILGTEPSPADPVVVDVAAALRLPPAGAADALLVKVGERVAPGAVLARSRDPKNTREVRAPRGGVVVSYDGRTGLATLVAGSGAVELRAEAAGTVRDVLPGRAALIETTGALVEGAWGAGGPAHGVVRLASRSPDEPPDPADLDHRFTYSILVVGGSLTADVLARCEALEVRAVVAGGMAPADLGCYLGYPDGALPLRETLERPRSRRKGTGRPPAVMLLAEFGAPGIPGPAWEVLSACEGREGGLAAPGWPAKPRLLVQLPLFEAPDPRPAEAARLETGARVRVLGGAYAHALATVVRYPAPRVPLPSGIPADGAWVRLEDGAELLVPTVNLRVVENARSG